MSGPLSFEGIGIMVQYETAAVCMHFGDEGGEAACQHWGDFELPNISIPDQDEYGWDKLSVLIEDPDGNLESIPIEIRTK